MRWGLILDGGTRKIDDTLSDHSDPDRSNGWNHGERISLEKIMDWDAKPNPSSTGHIRGRVRRKGLAHKDTGIIRFPGLQSI